MSAIGEVPRLPGVNGDGSGCPDPPDPAKAQDAWSMISAALLIWVLSTVNADPVIGFLPGCLCLWSGSVSVLGGPFACWCRLLAAS